MMVATTHGIGQIVKRCGDFATIVIDGRAHTIDLADESFATRVIAIASTIPTSNRWGELKIYLSDVRAAMRDTPRAEFDRQALECLTRGELQLARADLVGAMDSVRIAASEIQDPFCRATYHLVVITP